MTLLVARLESFPRIQNRRCLHQAREVGAIHRVSEEGAVERPFQDPKWAMFPSSPREEAFQKVFGGKLNGPSRVRNGR